jgi:hypothetical protein
VMEFNISGSFLESSHLADKEGDGNHTKLHTVYRQCEGAFLTEVIHEHIQR